MHRCEVAWAAACLRGGTRPAAAVVVVEVEVVVVGGERGVEGRGRAEEDFRARSQWAALS